MNKAVKEALKWVGYVEKQSNDSLSDFEGNKGDKNYTIFAEYYRNFWGDDYRGQPWCAVFVSVVFALARGKENMPFEPFAYCPTGVNYFKKKNLFFKSPKEGDVIFFTNGTRAYHTGIVTGVSDGKVFTIEGNTSSGKSVESNGGCVAKKSYSLSNPKILGYGRPDIKENICFSDCADHYAKKHIQKLADYGVVGGFADGSFRPDEYVTRGDAAIMIANALTVLGK